MNSHTPEHLAEGFKIANWTVEPASCLIRRDEATIHLEPKVMDLLVFMAAHSDRVITREELLEAVWSGVVVSDEALTNAVIKLRKALGDDSRHPAYLETIPKKGYRLIAPITSNHDPRSPLADAFPTVSGASVNSSFFPNKNIRIFSFIAVVLAIVALMWIYKAQQQKPAEQVTVDSRIDRPNSTIVVLPFRNLSDDPKQEYFSAGMTQDLTTDLSKISALTVIARGSTLGYQTESPDLKTIARELNVRYVVQGSVQKTNDKVRINTQLIDTETMQHLWAERYDREYKRIFALQDDILGDIVSALSLTLTPDETKRIAQLLTDNPKAYDLYLQALQQESFFTKESAEVARELFIQAIELDPGFAAAYAHLAQGYSLLVENQWTEERDKFQRLAIEMGLKGIALDKNLPYAYWSLGRIYTRAHTAEPHKAINLFEKAMSLDPNFADGYMFLAITYIFIGQADKAPSLIEKAMRLNPHYPFWYLQTLGMAQFFMMNYEASVLSLEASVEKNPNVPWVRRYLIASYGQLGMTEDAEWQISEMEMLGQPVTIEAFLSITPLHDPVYRTIYQEALQKAGVPDK